MFEWYYVGQYGQLGPLDLNQMIELAESGVILPNTYVWKDGMSDWREARFIPELIVKIPNVPPPSPPPMPAAVATSQAPAWSMPPSEMQQKYFASQSYLYQGAIASPFSRVLAGVLNIFLPGIGRIYLGYQAIGVLQLVLTICTLGIFWIWPFIDGILILVGTVRHDGYGRSLQD